jgi:ElaB/YqjD/DUF883 family membrane-anchored ribosome-binding protein
MQPMKHFTCESHWDEIKAQLRQRFAQLTDDDLAFVKGKGQELLARLREKLGLSAEDLDSLLTEIQTAVRDQATDTKAKLGALADDARTRAHTLAEDAKAKASAAAEEVKAQAAAACGQARERARGCFSDGEEYVRQNPRESLVAAICAGFVAGLLIRR